MGVNSSRSQRTALGSADKLGVAGDDGGDGVFEGRHAAAHLADGLDGGGRRSMADGDAEAGGGVRGAAMGAAADDVAGVAGTGGVPGIAGVAGVGGGAGEAGDFVGGRGQVEDGGQGIGVAEGSQVAAAEVVAEDGVGQGDLETTGGVVAQADVDGQSRCGVGGGAADGVRGVGEAVDEGVDVVRRVRAGGCGGGDGGFGGVAGMAKEGIAAGLVVLDGSHNKEGSFQFIGPARWLVVGGGLAANGGRAALADGR